MLFSDMNEEQKRQFFEEQEARVDKLRTIRPKVNMNNVVSQEEVIRIKEAKKRKARELYWSYHKRPINHPDNWRKI
jgi:hypothetical protein